MMKFVYRLATVLVFGMVTHANTVLAMVPLSDDIIQEERRRIGIVHAQAVYVARWNVHLATTWLNHTLQVARRIHDRESMAQTYHLLAEILGYQQERFDVGIQCLEQSNQYTTSPDLQMKNRVRMGILRYGLGDIASSLNDFSVARAYYETKQDKRRILMLQVYQTGVGGALGRVSYDSAFHQYSSVLHYAMTDHDTELELTCLYFYIHDLTIAKRYKEAGIFLEQAFRLIDESVHQIFFLQRFYLLKAVLQGLQGELTSAITFAHLSIDMSRTAGLRHAEAAGLFELGKLWEFQGDPQQALHFFQQASMLYQQLKMKKRLMEVYRTCAHMMEEQGDHQRALVFHRLQDVYQDSLSRDMYENFNKRPNLSTSFIQGSQQLIDQKNSHIKGLYLALLIVVILVLIYSFLRFLNIQRLQMAKEKSNLVGELLHLQNDLLVLQRDLENEKMEGEKLKLMLQFNAKSLTTNTLNIIHKNEVLDNIKARVEELRNIPQDEVPAKLNGLMNALNFALNIDRDWDNFKTHFEQVHVDFFENIKREFPELNSHDLKLCALIKLNLDTKQMATVLDISPESVKVARSRLRKKLGIATGDNLSAFINRF